MKYFVMLLFLIAVFSLYSIHFTFATQENPVYAAKPSFPVSIKIGEIAPFSVRMTNDGVYLVSDIEPVIDVYPKSASEFVHIQIKPEVSVLWGGHTEIVHGTIYVDKNIPVERVFVSVAFAGKNNRGEQISLKIIPENNASIKIEKESLDVENSNEIISEHNKQKLSCMDIDPSIPLYGCGDTVRLDSPLKQFKSGISVDKIACKEGLILITRSSDDSPACVKYETGAKLIQHAWGVCSTHLFYNRDHPCGPHSSPAMKYKSPFVADKYGKVTLDGKDALDICSAVGIPCPTNPVSYGKMLDENNVLVKISGTSDFDVKLNQTHVCVTSKTETTCEIR